MQQEGVATGFEQRIVDGAPTFAELMAACTLEPCGRGRQAAVLVRCKGEGLVPLVRTTTPHQQPAQRFRPVHEQLVSRIEACFGRAFAFNNAMVERYDASYRKMGFHTDQSQDLQDDSCICLFSCYDVSPPEGCRTLVVQYKASKETGRVVLEHNSAVLFHTSTNRHYLHKIVLECQSKSPWLGVTLRCSKRSVCFIGGVPFLGAKQLRLASDEERQSLLHHKGTENATDGVYSYPELDFTISKSDLMEPV
jgi:hypothetical protein